MANKKVILLVEDDIFVSDIYQTKLGQEGFRVLTAENGTEAIKKLKESVPDLILLDIVMPYMDGMEVLRKLKEKKEWKDIPVMLLTNLSDKEKVDEGMGMGASDYLIKSHFTPSEVVAKVRSLL